MSTRIEKDYIFESGIYFKDEFHINVVEMTLSMEVISQDMHEQNVAIERLDYFVYNSLQDCIFISRSEIEVIEKYKNAGLKLCVLVDEPYDQIVASLIMIKTNTILEKRLAVEDIVFQSKNTGGLRFTVNYEDLPKHFFKKNWWTSSDLRINDFEQKEDNIVNLFNDDWASLELSWKSKQAT